MTWNLTAQGKPRLSENDVESQITDFLKLRGWKPVRLNSALIDLPYNRKGEDQPAKMRIGEPGMVDWLAVHPKLGHVWFEVKAPGRKPTETTIVRTRSGKYRKRKGQLQYLRELSAAGFCCGWFDSIEGFRKFYEKRFE